MLAVSIKLIFCDGDKDDKSDDNVVMKSLFVTKSHHFLELLQNKVCVSVFYVLPSLSRLVCLSICLFVIWDDDDDDAHTQCCSN